MHPLNLAWAALVLSHGWVCITGLYSDCKAGGIWTVNSNFFRPLGLMECCCEGLWRALETFSIVLVINIWLMTYTNFWRLEFLSDQFFFSIHRQATDVPNFMLTFSWIPCCSEISSASGTLNHLSQVQSSKRVSLGQEQNAPVSLLQAHNKSHLCSVSQQVPISIKLSLDFIISYHYSIFGRPFSKSLGSSKLSLPVFCVLQSLAQLSHLSYLSKPSKLFNLTTCAVPKVFQILGIVRAVPHSTDVIYCISLMSCCQP